MIRPAKRHLGRTPISSTPLHIKTRGLALAPEVEERTRKLLRRRLARFGTLIERVDVRFKDINGPRGGVDTVARIHLSVAGRPPVFVQERALDAAGALSRAASSITRAMDRATGKAGLAAPAATRAPAAEPAPRPSAPPASRRGPSPRKRQRRRTGGIVYKLEESATKPSRKSTRKSDNRAKGARPLGRRTRRAKHTPRARASRAQRQRQRSRRGR
jgi:hypothetical protein